MSQFGRRMDESIEVYVDRLEMDHHVGDDAFGFEIKDATTMVSIRKERLEKKKFKSNPLLNRINI